MKDIENYVRKISIFTASLSYNSKILQNIIRNGVRMKSFSYFLINWIEKDNFNIFHILCN